MTEAVTDAGAEAARAADAMQAAYFRGVLAELRAQLEVTVVKLRSQMDEAPDDPIACHRLQHEICEHKFELSQINWLISRLDRRYAMERTELDAELGYVVRNNRRRTSAQTDPVAAHHYESRSR
jgi:hypothetical protein